MTTQITDLIARLEKAEGPDCELDAEIYALVDPNVIHANPPYMPGYVGLRDSEFWTNKVPLYTTSIDAALTLVPEGKDLIVSWVTLLEQNGETRKSGCAIIGIEFPEYATTPAIALCIAALKARLAVGEK